MIEKPDSQHTKRFSEEKKRFTETAEIQKEPKINFNNPRLLQAHLNEDGKLIVPVGWRCNDEDK